jgi:hypothetical protein
MLVERPKRHGKRDNQIAPGAALGPLVTTQPRKSINADISILPVGACLGMPCV